MWLATMVGSPRTLRASYGELIHGGEVVGLSSDERAPQSTSLTLGSTSLSCMQRSGSLTYRPLELSYKSYFAQLTRDEGNTSADLQPLRVNARKLGPEKEGLLSR